MKNLRLLLKKALENWYAEAMPLYGGENAFYRINSKVLGISEDELRDLMWSSDEEVAPNLNITDDTMVGEIISSLSDTQKDALYRALWHDHVTEDVKVRLSENPDAPADEDAFEALCSDVANAYVYNGEYDHCLSYWDNIDNLIKEHLTQEPENPETGKVFQFLYKDEEAENGVSNITYLIKGPLVEIEKAIWLWSATLSFSNATFRYGDTKEHLKEDGYDEKEIETIYESYPNGVSEDLLTAYDECICKLKEMGLTVTPLDDCDNPDVWTSHGVY